MTEFKKVAFWCYCMLLAMLISLNLTEFSAAGATVVKNIRTGSDAAYIRIVLETDRALSPQPLISSEGNAINISLTAIAPPFPDLGTVANHHGIVKLDAVKTTRGTRLEAVLSFKPTEVRTFLLTNPHRLVIDAFRPPGSAAGDASTGDLQSIALVETNRSQPNTPGEGQVSASQNQPTPETVGRSRFQQRMLATLIVVTSILLVVIIFLMCKERHRQ